MPGLKLDRRTRLRLSLARRRLRPAERYAIQVPAPRGSRRLRVTVVEGCDVNGSVVVAGAVGRRTVVRRTSEAVVLEFEQIFSGDVVG